MPVKQSVRRAEFRQNFVVGHYRLLPVLRLVTCSNRCSGTMLQCGEKIGVECLEPALKRAYRPADMKTCNVAPNRYLTVRRRGMKTE
jgi:hypothetical protein